MPCYTYMHQRCIFQVDFRTGLPPTWIFLIRLVILHRGYEHAANLVIFNYTQTWLTRHIRDYFCYIKYTYFKIAVFFIFLAFEIRNSRISLSLEQLHEILILVRILPFMKMNYSFYVTMCIKRFFK